MYTLFTLLTMLTLFSVYTIKTDLHCLNNSMYAQMYIVIRLERCWIQALGASEKNVRVDGLGDG